MKIDEPAHISEDARTDRLEYAYDMTGVGVHRDLVNAVLDAWSKVSPDANPTTFLRAADTGVICESKSIARMAVKAVLEQLGLVPE